MRSNECIQSRDEGRKGGKKDERENDGRNSVSHANGALFPLTVEYYRFAYLGEHHRILPSDPPLRDHSDDLKSEEEGQEGQEREGMKREESSELTIVVITEELTPTDK